MDDHDRWGCQNPACKHPSHDEEVWCDACGGWIDGEPCDIE